MAFIITALAILLFLPLANAEINLNPLAKTTYNKGDTLKVAGYVRSSEAGTFPLTMYLSCDTRQVQISTKNLNVIAEKDYPISTQVVIPYSIAGSCDIRVNFGTEQVSSEPFTISKGLIGTFTLSPLSIQLGDKIIFSGKVTKLNGDLINGQGIVYIASDTKNFITANVDIKDSKFEYKTKVDSIPEGSYQINLAVNDLYGNEEFFWNAATLNTYQNLKVTATIDKQQYSPDETIKIKGSVDKTIGTSIPTAQVKFTLDDQEYVSDVTDNKFEYDLPLSSTLKSFDHDLTITITDEYGNVGEKIVKIYIIPKEVKLESGIDKDSFAPKEIIAFNPTLSDQATNAIDDNIVLTVTDSQNVKVLDKQIPTNQEFNLKLNQYAAPGNWKYVLKSKTLTTEGIFDVQSISNIDVQLQGQILKVKNTGNTKYTEDLVLTATDDSNTPTNVVIKTNLEPGKEVGYQLFKDLKQGIYQLYIENKGLKFDTIKIVDPRDITAKVGDFFSQATGAAIGAPGTSNNYKPLVYMSVVLFVIIFTIFFMNYRGRLKTQIVRDKERRLGQQRLQQIQSSPEVKKQKYGRATQADIKDFQQRIQKDLQQNSIRSDPMDSENRSVKSSIERKIVYDRYKRE